jgi:hypothetical protein
MIFELKSDKVTIFQLINVHSSYNDLKAMSIRVKLGRGRPRKFGRRAHSVTLTLPDDILERLCAIDTDVGRAIVGLVERVPRKLRRVRPAAEVASYGNHAVILVTPVPALKKLRGVQLVPMADGRALIALDQPRSIPQLELDVREMLERRVLRASERRVLEALAAILRDARTSHRLTVVERSIIVLEARRGTAEK